MKFRFRHGPFQSEQKSIVKVARIIEPILIEDESIGKGTDFQKPVPIRRVAGQSRNFQAEHNASPFQTHFRHQLLKAFAIGRRGCGLAEVAVDNHDPLQGPAQGYSTLTKVILSQRALGVLQHLAQSGLPYIKIGVSLQMAGVYLFRCSCIHSVAFSCCRSRMIPAISVAIWVRRSIGTVAVVAAGWQGALAATRSVPNDRACIQAVIP
jgi:hypothetical protein